MSTYHILNLFDLPEGEKSAEPFGNGHINTTFLIRIAGAKNQYILQRINSYVFARPKEVMENIGRVTAYLRERILEEGGDPDRETLKLIPARDGKSYAEDAESQVWRVFLFVPDSEIPRQSEEPELLTDCGRAFGRFSRQLKDFPAASLRETIKGFHDTPARLAQLEDAVRRNPLGRLREVEEEVAFARSREAYTRVLTDALAAGRLPVRVTHNDLKVDNMLLDRRTGKPLCVVDLDTVMPGLLAYDFGEAIRAGAATAPEDERDLSRVHLDLNRFRAFARGYLPEMRGVMDREELLSLESGARMMTLENGMRFLADYLNGDVYYRITRPRQNLDRCRAAFTLLREMEGMEKEARGILTELYPL